MADALACTLLSYKTVPTRKVFQAVVELPIEQASQAIALFGQPDPDGATWLALARLAPTKSGPVAKSETTSGVAVEPKRERKLSEIAAIKCNDPAFQMWVHGSIIAARAVGDVVAYFDDDPATWTSQTVKSHLGVKSRTELDVPGPKAEAFKRLLTDFDLRNTVR